MNLQELINAEIKAADELLALVTSEERAFSAEKSIFLEKIFVMTPYNPRLLAGKTVDVSTYTTKQAKAQELSKRFSSSSEKTAFTRYLILRSEHIWNGETNKGFCALILGRKFIDIPSTYNYKTKLMSP